jgi:O-antigen biosynthesis protein
MRQGRREETHDAELIHQLNQRYRQEFDRAERLRAELVAIQASRLWPWFCKLRSAAAWCKSLLTLKRLRSDNRGHASAWWQPFEPRVEELLHPKQVSIIIPFRDQLDLLQRCLQALRRTAVDAEIVLVDNGSVQTRTKVFLKEWESIGLGKCVRREEPFNFARLCNVGAEAATRDVLLFLNNDILATQQGWLEAMLAVAGDSRVGVAGATLLYPDRTLQHVGLAATGPGVGWQHPYRFHPEAFEGDSGELTQVRCVPAVTGACLMIRRALFDQLGGFDEQYPVTMNDVDLCQRVKQAGREVVVTPAARLWHFESLSRGYRREAA